MSASSAATIPGAWSAVFSGQEGWIVVETFFLLNMNTMKTFWATLSYEPWHVDMEHME